MEVIDNNGHDFTQTQEQSDRVNVPIKKIILKELHSNHLSQVHRLP